VVDYAGNESSPSAETAVFPGAVDLLGPYPHPIITRDDAVFTLRLPPRAEAAEVDLRIYTVAGNLVKRRWGGLLTDPVPPGAELRLIWDTRNDNGDFVAPGLYFVKVTAGDYSELRKIYVATR